MMYERTTCPACDSRMYNGKCENIDCQYHWNPIEETESIENNGERLLHGWQS